MPYYLEVPLSNGETVLAEISRQVDDVAPFGRGKEVLGRLTGSLADGLDHVRAFASDLLTCMMTSRDQPDRVAVEFGLVLSAKAGVTIAEVASEGHVTVTVEWSRAAGSMAGTQGHSPAEESQVPGAGAGG